MQCYSASADSNPPSDTFLTLSSFPQSLVLFPVFGVAGSSVPLQVKHSYLSEVSQEKDAEFEV